MVKEAQFSYFSSQKGCVKIHTGQQSVSLPWVGLCTEFVENCC